MIHSITASYKNVLIRQPETRDLESLRIWRNNEANSKYISKVDHITYEMQLKWFGKYLEDEDHCMFMFEEIEELNRVVGSVAIYNFRPGICECGKFMVGDEAARGKGIGRLGITLAMYAGFEAFGLTAIDAVVHVDNISALTTDQKAGFMIVGEHPNPSDPGKMEKELLSPKDYFYGKHGFLREVKLKYGV